MVRHHWQPGRAFISGRSIMPPFRKMGLDLVYLAFRVKSLNGDALRRLTSVGEMHDLIQRNHSRTRWRRFRFWMRWSLRHFIGAINTIVAEGKLKGFNTDASGSPTLLKKAARCSTASSSESWQGVSRH